MELIEAGSLLYQLMDRKECPLNNKESFIDHSVGVSRFLRTIVKEKGLHVCPKYIAITGLLHDIGRCVEAAKRHGIDFHEYTGARLIEMQGERDMADVIKRHGFAYEKAGLLLPEDLGVAVVNAFDFYPESMLAKLLTYSDLRVDSNGKVVPYHIRLKSVREKEAGQPYMEKGLQRLEELCVEMEK